MSRNDVLEFSPFNRPLKTMSDVSDSHDDEDLLYATNDYKNVRVLCAGSSSLPLSLVSRISAAHRALKTSLSSALHLRPFFVFSIRRHSVFHIMPPHLFSLHRAPYHPRYPHSHHHPQYHPHYPHLHRLLTSLESPYQLL